MPLDVSIVGQSTSPVVHDVDARWLMAYAAGIGDLNPRYLDTQAHPVVAHPVFPVCLEWPVNLASGQLSGYRSLTAAEAARSVHAAHDLHLIRPIRAGERLTTRATVTNLAAVKPGAAVTTRLDTIDDGGLLVCRTYQQTILRDVGIGGAPPCIEAAPPTPGLPDLAGAVDRISIPVSAGAAHVYTECARIWNPIHTDRQVALAAGLPDIILHGTATLALAVTRLVDTYLAGDPTRVRRLGGRFTAMVPMPSTLALEALAREPGTLCFLVRAEGGRPAFDHGFLCYE